MQVLAPHFGVVRAVRLLPRRETPAPSSSDGEHALHGRWAATLAAVERVCVFCGASSGRVPAYAEAARAFGTAAARRGLGVVYGGGRVGLMGAVADGALAAGGQVIGVIPQELVDRELAHDRLTELHVVGSLHERKALMAELSDGFVALPGGFGTLDELMEQLTWSQLGLHRKPVGLLDVEEYWRPLIALARHATEEGFVRESDLGAIAIANDAEALLDRLAQLERGERPRAKNGRSRRRPRRAG